MTHYITFTDEASKTIEDVIDNLYRLTYVVNEKFKEDLIFAANYISATNKEVEYKKFVEHAIDCECEGCALDADIGAEEVVYTNAEQWAFYYNGKPLQEIEESLELTQPSVEFCKQVINTGRLYEDRIIKLKAYIEKYETYE